MSEVLPTGPWRIVETPFARAIAWGIGPRGLRSQAALRREVEGKVVVITGASFGVREATARWFAAVGAGW